MEKQEKCTACGRPGNAVCPKCKRMRCVEHIHIKAGKPFDAWCYPNDCRGKEAAA